MGSNLIGQANQTTIFIGQHDQFFFFRTFVNHACYPAFGRRLPAIYITCDPSPSKPATYPTRPEQALQFQPRVYQHLAVRCHAGSRSPPLQQVRNRDEHETPLRRWEHEVRTNEKRTTRRCTCQGSLWLASLGKGSVDTLLAPAVVALDRDRSYCGRAAMLFLAR